MLKAAAKAIINAANEVGIDMTLREDYSGRGMYGKTTDGIIFGSYSDLMVCIATAAINVKGEEDYYDNRDELEVEEPEITVDDFMDSISNVSFDSMGRYDNIAY